LLTGVKEMAKSDKRGWLQRVFFAPSRERIIVMPLTYTRDLVLKKVADCFPDPAVASEALTLLDTYGEESAEGRARIQLAILKQCDGQLDRVQQLLGLAERDYRDLLVGAEYPEEFPASSKTPPDEMAAIRRRDRAQYEKWLNSAGA
jgi:hypothetical protein